jgi:uncharacterized membrane protein YcjF (UPF0283 family)
MSTGAIIAIVAGVILLLILLAVLWRMSSRRREQRRLVAQRKEVASAHRGVAQEKATRAEVAESQAKRERAEAELHEARAKLHERGLADDELDQDRGALDRDGRHDGSTADTPRGADDTTAGDRTTSESESERPLERH